MATMRSSAFLLLFLLSMVCGFNGSSISNAVMRKKLQIDIYYISLCPGSMEFMTTELAPAYAKYKNYINVNFIPFSQEKRIGSRTVFKCMHGPDECDGNMLQSCVLDALGDDQDKKVQFVVCQMDENADSTGRNCIKSLNISYGSVIECTHGPKGFELQLSVAEQARKLAREVFSKSDGFYVPMAVFDKVYSESDAKKARSNFTQIIQEKLKGLQLFDEKSQESDESDDGNEEEKDAYLGEINANDYDSSEENLMESDILDEKAKELNLVDENTNDPELNSSTEPYKSSARMNILCKHTYLFAVFIAFAATF